MNAMSIVLKIVIMITGVLLLGDAVFSLAKRKMTESYCLMWALFSIITIIAGAIIRPSKLSDFLSPISFILILMVFFLFIYVALFFSRTICDLVRKNNELAIRVSLLIRENEEIRDELKKLEKGAPDSAEKGPADTVGNRPADTVKQDKDLN